VFALILFGILVLEQQLENHVLQPLVVGRLVRFHPLGIIVALAVGGIVAGIAGAAVAVPLSAVLYRALPELRKHPDPPANSNSSTASAGSDDSPEGSAAPKPDSAPP
jgi:predicted PurR-regulated permease PerM